MRGADSEEIVTYISEGMTVTSADEEKLQLLNKNTELRRLNKELMKLNQEWDQIYHSTTLGLQQKVRVLQQEMLTLRQQTERLTMKLDHEQSKREYYEQTLIQELKKNQHLQEYVRQLEGGRHHGQDRRPAGSLEAPGAGARQERPDAPFLPPREGSAERSPRTLGSERRGRLAGAGPDKEVTDLKDQLEALKCQTEIYEADYRTEQRDRERIEAENEKLRKKEEEMRQQMLLLQEQLKIFEDDFRKERSDKQLLQRLLKSKSSPREPVLVHRCNSHEKPGPAAASTPSGASGPRRAGCSRHCEKPSRKQGECAGHSEAQLPAFGRDY
ncbi:TNFAIP3-interacting protein 1-like [Apteryx mantelli]|uniref:TNFAIP3-interacting protein 1-like n=1 Tax=Apteryx mantelli TaxID=2696672 RepID=A0ABM4F6F0_9AVES